MHVAVVGTGPAGLMAAETLATAGAAVRVFEQHRSPGRKFLLAGRSGLNLTHSEPLDELLDRYGPDRPQLESMIRSFDAGELQRWCEGLGEPIVVGSSGRVFPESFRATPLLRSWLERLDDLGVEFSFRHRWRGWGDGDHLVFDQDGPYVGSGAFDATILALGGSSWPRVGGDGSWQDVLAAAGVTTRPLTAANCGALVPWSSQMLSRHEGEPVKNVAVKAGNSSWRRGDIVITRTGLEGGPIYAASRSLRDVAGGILTIDLQPDLDTDAVRSRLERRRRGATQTTWLRTAGLSPVVIGLVRDATSNSIPDDPAAAAQLLKRLDVATNGLAPLERAISSAGGVPFDSVDDRLMVTAKPGVFVAGEMLDWEAPTGGYLLQACFSTGVAAANGVIEWLDAERADTNTGRGSAAL